MTEVSGSVFLGDLGGTVRVGNVRVGLFSRRELSGRKLIVGKLSLWGSCLGGKCPGGKCPGGNLPVTIFILLKQLLPHAQPTEIIRFLFLFWLQNFQNYDPISYSVIMKSVK